MIWLKRYKAVEDAVAKFERCMFESKSLREKENMNSIEKRCLISHDTHGTDCEPRANLYLPRLYYRASSKHASSKHAHTHPALPSCPALPSNPPIRLGDSLAMCLALPSFPKRHPKSSPPRSGGKSNKSWILPVRAPVPHEWDDLGSQAIRFCWDQEASRRDRINIQSPLVGYHERRADTSPSSASAEMDRQKTARRHKETSLAS